MLTVEDYRKIRIAQRDGLGIRAIARTLHHSRRKVRQALADAEPKPYTRTQPVTRPKLGAFLAIIQQILQDDQQAPRKQRHTAMQVFRRLVGEHQYRGGYDAVRRYIGLQVQASRPTFIPLDHPPGQRLEGDFGHIHVDYPDGRRLVPVLLLTWSFSHAPFALAVPSERLEAILAGMVAGLTFFDCVAKEVWWDNPTTLATAILRGRERRVQERYTALASHYRFEPRFCMPASGWEKPHVENRVYDLQRRWCTPVPRVQDDQELNTHLRRCCLAERKRTVAGQTQSIGQRWALDKAAAVTLPTHPFDPCVPAAGQVDHYQTVRYDKVRYSVPRHCTGLVTLKAYADRVAVVHRAQVVAEHPRNYQGRPQLDPRHYLVTLGRRPGALDHSNLYRQWQLPAAFAPLRAQLEARHGTSAGVRHYIRVLQLLAEHPLTRVQQAVEAALAGAAGESGGGGLALLDADLIGAHVERLRQGPAEGGPVLPDSAVPQGLRVPAPDLGRFNQLLTGSQDPAPSVPPASADSPPLSSPLGPPLPSSLLGDLAHA